jgi:hypothetical protein
MSAFRTRVPTPLRQVMKNTAASLIALTLILLLYVLVVPADARVALRWYLLFVAGLGIAVAIQVITVRYPVLWRSSAARGAKAVTAEEPPKRLLAIDRLVTRAAWDAAGFQLELRPILRAIAAQRLSSVATIDIDANPTAAHAILGERVWSLLTPVNLETARSEKGIDPADLRAAVEKLEEFGVVPRA